MFSLSKFSFVLLRQIKRNPSTVSLGLRRSFFRTAYALSKHCDMELEPGTLVGLDNPLLDMTVNISDDILLKKYDLQENNAIIAEEKHMPLFAELTKMEDIKYSAGGSGQNTMRVFQWMVDQPQASVFYGGVGKDKNGELLEKRARADGLDTHYQILESVPTGTCAVIVYGPNRSLIANLAAANKFTKDHLDSEENKCILQNALYFYTTGFFLSVSKESVMEVAQVACENKRVLIFNLSAPFAVTTLKKEIDELLPYIDIVIGNKEEALAYSAAHEWECEDIYEIGKRIRCTPKVSLRPRLVMITDSICPVLIFYENRVKEQIIPKIDKSKIVDTNGCGDAFVGGFLSQYVQRMPIDFCIRAGIWASHQIIQRIGVTLEGLPAFSDSCI